ncbi:hypothetical protein M413DRAFT_125756 [Hebeloma cylindrosporum]|uniref:Uncharacterized protein n=1 Tax=Hebeloma cylindrosporum TaxID=76867 RepID=A0A0C3CFF5_HEBCY|nr:hypothetical protein M413DRAFT_125756 [Hebeloma cylindrosporum h7]
MIRQGVAVGTRLKGHTITAYRYNVCTYVQLYRDGEIGVTSWTQRERERKWIQGSMMAYTVHIQPPAERRATNQGVGMVL